MAEAFTMMTNEIYNKLEESNTLSAFQEKLPIDGIIISPPASHNLISTKEQKANLLQDGEETKSTPASEAEFIKLQLEAIYEISKEYGKDSGPLVEKINKILFAKENENIEVDEKGEVIITSK